MPEVRGIVLGAPALVRRLQSAEAKLEARKLRKVLADALGPIARGVRRAAPYDPRPDRLPNLRKAVRRRSRVGSGRTTKIAMARVAVDAKGQPGVRLKGIAQEYGTTRHGAQPFVVPTFKTHKMGALDAVRDRVKEVFR